MTVTASRGSSARVLGLAALVVVLAGCGGGEGDGMRATLTDDRCTYEGETSPAAGAFTVDVENRTSMFGAFALARLSRDATGEDLSAFLETARKTFEETGKLPDPPVYYAQLVRAGVEAGGSSQLPADVPAGRYALVCFVDDLPTWRAILAAMLDVRAS